MGLLEGCQKELPEGVARGQLTEGMCLNHFVLTKFASVEFWAGRLRISRILMGDLLRETS